MKKCCLLLVVLSIFSSCSSPKVLSTSTPPRNLTGDMFVLTEQAPDNRYGLNERNPVNVGGGFTDGVKNQWRYLNGLAGPNGEEISFVRLGSCCAFKSKDAPMGGGLLDMYQITYEGLEKPITLYLNFYEEGPLLIPKGFTARKQ